ncbi:hypothetical protein WR25_04172 isoform C [Diploscapter pachys]|uniref:G-protein coupled receptors family 1 profile domain-containing protein n=2 Tax=Diploscapter pachys TaxID=2018661 RepID=A0A2A2LGC5_9BILA|nr:hypothetical protein WR25_04172 isoform C [Diploscapter pachys]
MHIFRSYYVPKNATPYCGHFCDETNWQSENSKKIYGTMVMLLQFIIPMAIITFCYTRILNKVSKDMIIQNAQFSQSLTQRQRIDAASRKKKVNYILIAMVLTFILCWLPLTLVNLVKDYKQEPDWLRAQPFLWPLIAHLIAMSLVVWNPLLFFCLTRKQKRMRFSKIINTSEMVASFANRIGDSVRRLSTRRSSKFDKARKRVNMERESEVSTGTGGANTTAVTRPLLIQAHSNEIDWCNSKEML